MLGTTLKKPPRSMDRGGGIGGWRRAPASKSAQRDWEHAPRVIGGTRTRRVESAHAWNYAEKASTIHGSRRRNWWLEEGSRLQERAARLGARPACDRRDENTKGRVRPCLELR